MAELLVEITIRAISVIFIGLMLYVFYIIANKSAEKNMKKLKSFYVCPKCASLRLEMTDKLPDATKYVGSAPAYNFVCHDCKYEGIAPKIDKENLENFRKDIEKSKKTKKKTKK